MDSKSALNAFLIASCGMNCGICIAHLRDDKQCPGCNGSGPGKPAHCVKCQIRHCERLAETQSRLCIDCVKFPCSRMKQLDKRYRTNYGMSMIENLQTIRTLGMEAFVIQEQARWRCSQCGGVVCVHRGVCYDCGKRKEEIILLE